MLRRCLLLLICLALPWQALAAVALQPVPCPMAAEMAERLAAGEAVPDAPADCCHAVDALAATGQACKAGQECGVSAGIVPATAAARAAEPAGGRLAVSVLAAWRSGPLGGPWRPPTAG